MKALQILLENSIDYAGLFPPAGLDMKSAVDNYAGYRRGVEAWALGRFVLPVGRLEEFAHAAARHLRSPSLDQPWQLAVLGGPDLAADLPAIAGFNQAHRGASIDTLELKAGNAVALGETMHLVPNHLQAYFEIPIDSDPAILLAVIAGSPARAKVRTGGVTPQVFPRTAELIRFLVACIRARVPFKATAGLHHPLRGAYRLTYAPDSARAPMFGFLNLFLTAAFLRAGMDPGEGEKLLEEGSPDAIQVDPDGIRWRSNRLDLAGLRRARQEVIVSFGSCSFTEPLSELRALDLLEPRVRHG